MEPSWGVVAVGCLFLVAGLVHVLLSEKALTKRENTAWKFFRSANWDRNPREAALRASGYAALLIGGCVILLGFTSPEALF